MYNLHQEVIPWYLFDDLTVIDTLSCDFPIHVVLLRRPYVASGKFKKIFSIPRVFLFKYL